MKRIQWLLILEIKKKKRNQKRRISHHQANIINIKVVVVKRKDLLHQLDHVEIEMSHLEDQLGMYHLVEQDHVIEMNHPRDHIETVVSHLLQENPIVVQNLHHLPEDVQDLHSANAQDLHIVVVDVLDLHHVDEDPLHHLLVVIK
jgi:Mg2+ and Co2+ transporter CorA